MPSADRVLLRMTILGPPVPKARARITYRTKLGAYRGHTPEKTRTAMDEVAWAAKGAGAEVFEGPVRLLVEAAMPIPKSWSKKKHHLAVIGLILPTSKPDGKNILALVEDALNGIVWRDDSQVIKGTWEKVYSDYPRTGVTVWALELEGGGEQCLSP